MVLQLFPDRACAQEVRTAYAITDKGDYEDGKGIYTFDIGDTINNIKRLQALNVESVSGGLLLDGIYYYMEYQQVYNGYKSLGFYSVDMDTKTVKQIADYGGTLSGPIASSLSYDYQNDEIYALYGFNGGEELAKVDRNTGTISSLGKLTFDVLNSAAQSSSVGENIHVMTSTYDGDFYGVSYWGSLYKINVHTLQCQYIGTLDYNPGQAFMYTSDCLFYDNDTDRLFLRYTTYNWTTSEWLYEVLQIDTKTAHVTRFADLKKVNGLNSISVPFTVAEASAPAKVQNLKLAVGDKGALTATLEWDNPSKTYGRGGTLEDLDYILVYRDGVLVDSLANPVIGAHQIWADGNITERGYYTYKIVAGNDMGRGDRTTIGRYVGAGDPLPVTDLKLSRVGSGAALSWTAPTEGVLDSYIDVASLNYDIIRFKDSNPKGETIQKAYKETSCKDESISTMGKYTYAIVPHTSNATGDTLKTEAMVLGPAYTIPCSFGFNTEDEFNLWTVIDANGNYSTWQWSNGLYGSLLGATVSYYYDDLAAADWLFSPRVKFEAGKRYKLTFDAKPGSKKITETLAITFGDKPLIENQDSVTQFDIVSDETVRLRANLPQVDTAGEYNVGFFYRSYLAANYKLSVGNVKIEEDHEGYVSGKVVSNGRPVEGATVIADAGKFVATTDASGTYRLDYLSQGEHTVRVYALGYRDRESPVTVDEYETSTLDFEMQALPEHTVEGQVKDVADDPVAGAKVVVSGYNSYETETDATGHFSINGVYENGNYSISVTKNKLLEGNKNFGVTGDTDLGVITLLDNQKPAGKVSVDATSSGAEVTWKAPANDAVEDRIDDGTLTTSVGISNASSNTMFGVVKREPASVSGVNFYIDGTSSVTHYSVVLNIFNLDENGNPTDSLLYRNTYIPVTDGQWNSYTLPAPVDAPNGYYLALSYSGYLLVGIDGAGDSSKYPFVEGVNCFTPDYTTGEYLYLESQQNTAYHHNFLIRPIAAPFTVPEDSTEFKGDENKGMRLVYRNNAEEASYIELDAKDYPDTIHTEDLAGRPALTPQSRIRYNVYRMSTRDVSDESKWTLVSEKQPERKYSDTDWKALPQGTYNYAVKAVYTENVEATAALSDSVGNKMLTNVSVHLKTLTPDNEAYGAKVTLNDGTHVFSGIADDNGDVNIPDVWKSKYNISVALDGFKSLSKDADLSENDSYELSYEIEEDRIKPCNLVIDDEDVPGERLFIWNYPNRFDEDFESHDDFAINSPGTIGWQYIDGDGAETGGFSYYTWPGAFSPMAYMVFNPWATTPDMHTQMTNMLPLSGEKALTAWASYGAQNDDWIITPKLHFGQDFRFSFYASSTDSYNCESIEVGYSTSDTNPESFTMVQDSVDVPAYFTLYSYDIPKEAKYVAVRCVSDSKRVLLIDDISFGISDVADVPYNLLRPAASNAPHKSPALEGLYEVYLDGVKVAQQDQTEYLFTGLSEGNHTAGVIASYTSGKTEMSTIEFSVNTGTGISAVENSGRKVYIENGMLTINGSYDRVQMASVDGKVIPVNKTGEHVFSLTGVPSGVYILSIYDKGKSSVMKIRVNN